MVRPSGVITSDAILDAVKTKVKSRDRDLPHRGRLMPDENVCSPRHGAQTVRGDMRSFLLNGDSTAFDMERGFTRHAIDESCEWVEGERVVLCTERVSSSSLFVV